MVGWRDVLPQRSQAVSPSVSNVINNNYFGPVNNIGQAFNSIFGANNGMFSGSRPFPVTELTRLSVRHPGSVNQTVVQRPRSTARSRSERRPTAIPRLFSVLEPILDASHNRNRKMSPPNSGCFPGTRSDVICDITVWAKGSILNDLERILWVFGYAGCGKSAVAQTVAEQLEEGQRLGASFFFFRGAGPRSNFTKFAATIASQIAINIPGTAQYIDKALVTHPGILTPMASSRSRFKQLVLLPIRAAFKASHFTTTYIIVIDGLDECDDKQEVSDFITHLIDFLWANPTFPIRFIITSRVEDYIRAKLHRSTRVRLLNLAERTSDEDIAAAFDVALQDAKGSRVFASNDEWPSATEKRALIKHIGGSFIFMTTIIRFLFDPSNSDGRTPIERLPLVLEMRPGFDGMYRAILERSQHLSNFRSIVGTIALAREPLTISQLAAILRIPSTHRVVNVLVRLHAILQVPDDDHTPVTLCHTSLHDFLCSKERSGDLCALPWMHIDLACWNITISAALPRTIGSGVEPSVINSCHHWREFVKSVNGTSASLESEIGRILTHLEDQFPDEFRSMVSTYLKIDHESLRSTDTKGLTRRHVMPWVVGRYDYHSYVLYNRHPWPLFHDILNTIMWALGDEALHDYLWRSFRYLCSPGHHMGMVSEGLRTIVALRKSDFAAIISVEDLGHSDINKYLLACWPRHLALALRDANPDVKPGEFGWSPFNTVPILRSAAATTSESKTIFRVLNDLEELAVSNVRRAERAVEETYGPEALAHSSSSQWDWDTDGSFVCKTATCCRVTPYDLLSNAAEVLSLYLRSCRSRYGGMPVRNGGLR
ncbi:hypothetical protein NMY22_g19612 [Coprinellus aureogranulatus]|nr:hypothetical protein NMY22_g19612 [Coprinellus aureogranulatus]